MKNTTTELTNKRYKLMYVISMLFMILSFVFVFLQTPIATEFALICLATSVVIYIYARIASWWNNG